MQLKNLLSILAFSFLASATAQLPTLTFTADNNGVNVPLDSILIQNLTQGGDTMLYYPDSVLVLDNVVTGINDPGAIHSGKFTIAQNYPNPMLGKTNILLHLNGSEKIAVRVSDMLGRELIRREYGLEPGEHVFRFYPATQSMYIFTVSVGEESQTIKMMNALDRVEADRNILEYLGKEKSKSHHRYRSTMKSIGYDLGDELQYTGFSVLGNITLIDTPLEDQTYVFQYASAGLPCPDAPTITDVEGNVYNTVLIGSQCWMKENLRTTTYNNEILIPNVTDQESWGNLTSEAYIWYNNDISWAETYGALYNGYTITDPDNDLCPLGWHVPSVDEWETLFNYIGGADDPFGNDLKSCRQINSPLGGDCATTEHPRWEQDAVDYGTDDYGFAGIPGGRRGFGSDPDFDGLGLVGYWWTSTESGDQLQTYNLHYSFGFVGGSFFTKNFGQSVKCVKD